MILPGLEPGISGSVDPRLIHWAIGPYERIMMIASTELVWFWFLDAGRDAEYMYPFLGSREEICRCFRGNWRYECTGKLTQDPGSTVEAGQAGTTPCQFSDLGCGTHNFPRGARCTSHDGRRGDA